VDITDLRASNLVSHIRRQQRLLEQYEQVRDLASDPKEIERATLQIDAIRQSLRRYVAELREVPGVGDVGLPSDIAGISGTLASPAAIRSESAVSGPTLLRILFLAASPAEEDRLRVDEEAREIEATLRMATLRDRFQLRTAQAARPQDLTQLLLDFAPHIVHFSGHGSDAGGLLLEGVQGQGQEVSADALSSLFKLVADSTQCVILNACYSAIQAEAIVRHIPFAIGMNEEFGDDAAVVFAAGFYQALGAGQSIERSFEFGVVQLRLRNVGEDHTPVLHKKA
jgi:hypothetical protein